jgi:hypothetical protein
MEANHFSFEAKIGIQWKDVSTCKSKIKQNQRANRKGEIARLFKCLVGISENQKA